MRQATLRFSLWRRKIKSAPVTVRFERWDWMLSSQMGWFLFRVRAVAVALRILRLAAAALLAIGLGVGAIAVAL